LNDEQTTTQSPQGRGRLTRKRSTGMLAGVASGLGEHFNVDPVIFRIAFGVSVFFGGFGLLAYIALALFLPDESGEPLVKSSGWGLVAAIALIGFFLVPAIGWGFWDGGPWFGLWLIVPAAIVLGAYAIVRDRGEPATAGRIIAAVFIAGAAIVGFCVLACAAAVATGFGHGAIVAAVVIVAGALVAVGAFAGGLRWLIVPALALAVGVGTAAAADLELEGGIGERSYTPINAEAIPDDGYQLAMGELVIDLRDLRFGPGAEVPVDASVGMGQLTVIVPERVCVEAEASATAGALRIAGERQEGWDVDVATGAAEATPRAVIDAKAQFGEVRVLNDDDVDADERFRWHDDGDLDQMRAAQAEACGA
jgi:phage shock protein PspC (stress-responsive transcriptional regulator)